MNLALVLALVIAVSGRYQNPTYGYSVRIPPGLAGSRAAAPAPNHGFELEMAAGTIEMEAHYNATFVGSLEEALDLELKPNDTRGLQKLGARVVRTSLGGLPALRLVHSGGAPALTQDVIVALRSVKGGTGIIYTASLVTEKGNYKRARRTFESMLRSWRLASLPAV